jgi:hypothetical protein
MQDMRNDTNGVARGQIGQAEIAYSIVGCCSYATDLLLLSELSLKDSS